MDTPTELWRMITGNMALIQVRERGLGRWGSASFLPGQERDRPKSAPTGSRVKLQGPAELPSPKGALGVSPTSQESGQDEGDSQDLQCQFSACSNAEGSCPPSSHREETWSAEGP